MTDRTRPQILPVDPAGPRREALELATGVLREGGVVALPTETFYGLAVDARNPAAIARLRAVKGLADDGPILLLVADRDQAAAQAGRLPAAFDELASRFWPGPLTLVLPAGTGPGLAVCGAGGTLGMRVPGLELPRALAAALGGPLTGTSANRHGRPPSRTAAAVHEAFGDELDLVLDGGPTAGGAPSTIVDLTCEPPRVLREGLLRTSSLRRFVELARDDL